MADKFPWWKTLTGKNKNILKEVQQEFANPDKKSAKQSSTDNKNINTIGDEAFDDSQLETVINEHTFRRLVKVSRSGRFRQKDRVRGTMPENNFFDRNTAAAK